MGGFWGEVEGPKKLSVWLAYKRLLRERGLETPEAQDAAGMFVRFPTNKREAFRLMRPKEDGSGWILTYGFHS